MKVDPRSLVDSAPGPEHLDRRQVVEETPDGRCGSSTDCRPVTGPEHCRHPGRVKRQLLPPDQVHAVEDREQKPSPDPILNRRGWDPGFSELDP